MNTLPILTTCDEITANLQAYAHDSNQAFSENTIKAADNAVKM